MAPKWQETIELAFYWPKVQFGANSWSFFQLRKGGIKDNFAGQMLLNIGVELTTACYAPRRQESLFSTHTRS